MRHRFVIAACLCASTAASADDRAVAKKLYDDGLRHYNVAEYPAAIAAWKQAYLLAKKPILLFNIGQAYRLSGDCKQAITFYDSYEREEPHPQNQDELDQARALCKEATVATPEPPPVTVPVHDQPVAPPPVKDQPAATAVAPVPPPARPSPRTSHLAAYVVGGAGLAAGITGIAFALDARAQDHKLAGVTEWTSENNQIQARGERDNKLSIAFGALGVAGLATGVVLYVLGHGDDEHGLAIAPTQGGLSFAWAGAF